jgi:hypothetical protein
MFETRVKINGENTDGLELDALLYPGHLFATQRDGFRE